MVHRTKYWTATISINSIKIADGSRDTMLDTACDFLAPDLRPVPPQVGWLIIVVIVIVIIFTTIVIVIITIAIINIIINNNNNLAILIFSNILICSPIVPSQ